MQARPSVRAIELRPGLQGQLSPPELQRHPAHGKGKHMQAQMPERALHKTGNGMKSLRLLLLPEMTKAKRYESMYKPVSGNTTWFYGKQGVAG